MQIAQHSKRNGVSARMLRYYEKDGLLQAERTTTGYRSYGEEHVSIVERIIVMNRAGLKLTTIRHLLECSLPGLAGSEPCQELKDRVKKTLIEVDQKIAELSESRKLLAALIGST